MRGYFILLVALFLCSSFSNQNHTEECDVVGFYKAADVPFGVKALNGSDELIELNTLLVPDKEIKAGRYKVSISRIDDNLYKVTGTKLYIETSLCLELAVYDEVILKVIDYQGYKFGTIIFID